MARARKMVNLNIEETSGVDHPAHLHEGWLVVKAADPTEVDRIVAALTEPTEEDTVPDEMTPVDETSETVDPAVEIPDTVEALMAELEAAKAQIVELQSVTESQVEDELALVKSASEPVQKAFEALREQAAAAMEKAAAVEQTLLKERETRADEAAVLWAREQFPHLSVDPSLLGPAMRKMAAVDADLAATVESALIAANAQADSGNLFAELGKAAPVAAGSAYDRLTTMAKAAVDSGAAATVEQAMASLAGSNPALYTDYLNEKGA